MTYCQQYLAAQNCYLNTENGVGFHLNWAVFALIKVLKYCWRNI